MTQVSDKSPLFFAARGAVQADMGREALLRAMVALMTSALAASNWGEDSVPADWKASVKKVLRDRFGIHRATADRNVNAAALGAKKMAERYSTLFISRDSYSGDGLLAAVLDSVKKDGVRNDTELKNLLATGSRVTLKEQEAEQTEQDAANPEKAGDKAEKEALAKVAAQEAFDSAFDAALSAPVNLTAPPKVEPKPLSLLSTLETMGPDDFAALVAAVAKEGKRRAAVAAKAAKAA